MAYRFGIAPTVNTTATGDNNIDAITYGEKWADQTVSYSYTHGFDQYGPEYENYFFEGEIAAVELSPAQQAVMNKWIENVNQVSNLNLVEYNGAANGHLVFNERGYYETNPDPQTGTVDSNSVSDAILRIGKDYNTHTDDPTYDGAFEPSTLIWRDTDKHLSCSR